MNKYSRIIILLILTVIFMAPHDILAQRATQEDIYGESAGSGSSNLITGIVFVIFIGLLFYGIIASKGVRQALGLYLLMLAGAIGIPGLIFTVFGGNAAIFTCILLLAGLYFYDSKSIGVTTSSAPAKKSRSEFPNDLEYYLHAITFKPKGKYHWYKFRNGIGIKETGQIFNMSQLEAISGIHSGYWISLYNDIDKGHFFISSDCIEVVGIDYKNNKFLSRCPSCDQTCRGTVYSEVTIRCPKCSYNWTQRVE